MNNQRKSNSGLSSPWIYIATIFVWIWLISQPFYPEVVVR